MSLPQLSGIQLLLAIGFLFEIYSGGPSYFGWVETSRNTSIAKAVPARGPLRISTVNPRYFTDGSGEAIYLTGSHTWATLQDFEKTGNAPTSFDYVAYLDFLQSYGHNFIRLWAWESSRTRDHSSINPLPYVRTGPGNALDGSPKFDLTRFNNQYFDRLRSRVVAARDRGLYVMVMLFQGPSINKSGWTGHPHNAANNINDVAGDLNGDDNGEEIHTLRIPAITKLQESYVRKIIDSLNDLDNVIYEICNECRAESFDWQYHMINTIHGYEKSEPKQHPVVMTVAVPKDNKVLFNSPAEGISPGPRPGENYTENPPAADGTKVIISDTDHLWGVGGDHRWVWKSFTRGIHTIFMDPYDGAFGGKAFDPRWEPARRNMGYTLAYARRMNLIAMAPRGDLASSGYCLTNPGEEYLVYLPAGSGAVDLSAAARELSVEWFDPATGKTTPGVKVSGGTKRMFTAPFNGDAVLYLKALEASSRQ